jgi:selenocysteine lyase/cysteine desulfurase
MDHNSVLRPTRTLEARWGGRLRVTRLAGDPETGAIDPPDLRAAITPQTRLVAVSHASNVAGTIQPIAALGAVCRSAAVPFLVDAAQSMGHVPIDFEADAIDLLAFPGHKGLLGPLGTGGLIMRPGMERSIATVREGGTGSRSEHDAQPDELPDKYEPGSHNLPGIAGLLEAVRWIAGQTVERIRAHEIGQIEAFFAGLRGGDAEWPRNIRVLGPSAAHHRIGVICIVIDGVPPGRVSEILEDRFGVLTRSGLHCAPRAHRAMGTDPDSAAPGRAGATRFSFGPFLTEDQVRFAGASVRTIALEFARSGSGAAPTGVR